MEFSYDLDETQAEGNNVSRIVSWLILKPFDPKTLLNITNSTPLTSHIFAKKLPQTMFIGTFIRYVYSFSVNSLLVTFHFSVTLKSVSKCSNLQM